MEKNEKKTTIKCELQGEKVEKMGFGNTDSMGRTRNNHINVFR